MPQLSLINQKQTFSQVKKEFDSLLQQKSANFIIKLTFIFLGGSLLATAWFFNKLPPQIPLLYSRPWGESQLISKIFAPLLPIASFVLTIINLRLASFLFKKESFLSQTIVWINLSVVILAAITLLRIFLIVT